jgi:histidyl-tRNA synthetase
MSKDCIENLKMNLLPVKGTRDFPPEKLKLRNYLFENFRKISKLFGFEEYDSPILECTNIYERKQGEEITKQLFNFDYIEENVKHRVCLRPELTPSMIRLVLQKEKSLLLPIKWFTIG